MAKGQAGQKAELELGATPPDNFVFHSEGGNCVSMGVLIDGEELFTKRFDAPDFDPECLLSVAFGMVRVALKKSRDRGIKGRITSEDRQTLNEASRDLALAGTEPQAFSQVAK